MKDWLDAQLSRVTMYRLVTLCLSALLVASGLFALTGYFSFSPIELFIATSVLIGATLGTSKLFGWLFGVSVQSESSAITGLILAFLFMPPTSWQGWAVLVFIGVIAGASKFLLAIRGRHIFNPAAVAAVIAGAVGLAGASWWVATPALLPVVVMISLLILYKTRRLLMGGVFVAVAVVAVTLQGMLAGEMIGESLWLAVASWPIVFFAGVMLSEPLTQPPRRSQQLAIAALVAVLLAMPLQTSVLTMSPALALLIGNAISWWLGTRRAVKLKFVERKRLTPSSYEFIFEGTAPFRAGQYIELMLPHKKPDSRGARRVFTIATSPGDKSLRFGIKIPERSSTFKQALMVLQPGKVIQATRIAGDFVLPKDTKQPVLFVAGGIGITPLISYIRARQSHDITLVYAVSSPAEIAYRDVLAVSGMKVIVVVPGGKAEVPGGWKVVDGAFVSEDILAEHVADLKDRTAYISGPPLMVNAVKRSVRKLGARFVHTDHFSGY